MSGWRKTEQFALRIAGDALARVPSWCSRPAREFEGVIPTEVKRSGGILCFTAVEQHKRFLGSRPGEQCASGHTARERIAVA
jgi:hypothetical protein